MCLVAYILFETMFKLTSVTKKHRVAPIRQRTKLRLEIQDRVYGVRLRKQILDKHDVRNDKIYHWTESKTVRQWIQSAHRKQQKLLRTEQRKYRKTHRWINGDTPNVSKVLPT